MIYKRKEIHYVYKKWFHHMGTMRVVKKRSTGELILVASEEHADSVWPVYRPISDAHALDVFIWLGRYLAKKGKLPRHLRLDEIALQVKRSSRDIQAVIATEHFQSAEHERLEKAEAERERVEKEK